MVDLYTAGFFIGFGESIQASAIDLYFEQYQTSNSVQGCKIGWDYIEHLNTHLKFGEVDYLIQSLDKVIVLTRRDKLAQAISRLVARQSTQWTSEDMPTEAAIPLEYDRKRLIYFMAQIEGYQRSLFSILNFYNLDYFHLDYEDLIKTSPDFKNILVNIFNFLEIWHTGAEFVVKPTLQKQINPNP
jgi:LPS sulfotransferase NodH